MLSILFVVTLVLIALLMGTTFGHVLEMPSKLRADQACWLIYQGTLYRYFAAIGGPIEIGALLCAGALTYALRGHGLPFSWALASTVAIAVAFFLVWVFVTNPVNRRTALWWSSRAVPADWRRWRARWEYSHALRFALHLFAFIAALTAVLSGSH